MNEILKRITEKFQTEGKITDIKPLGEGFINSTYIVKTEGNSPDYILQKKNKSIFPNVPMMMDNIVRITEHIANKISARGGNPAKEVLTVVKTHDGLPYFKDEEDEYWAMCLFIPDTVGHDIADSPRLAYKGGEGLGKFQMLLSDFTQPLYETIKGFHNLRHRFMQWDESLRADNAGRKKDVAREIEEIEKRRDEMMKFWHLVEDGTIPKRVTHNDTKLSNILFDKDDNVICMIDLDTVMSNTILADYGDAIRSFANTGAEDDQNLDRVSVNREIYNAYTEGYLSQTRGFLTEIEKEYMPFGPRFITFEQTLRFLMDYIDGDKYYRIAYPQHNLVRARAQQKLLESIEALT